jgi:4-amino-4-deoxy-L-arabinose transferase-like glycosyltransferase
LLWAGLLLALAIAVPWHAAAWRLHGEDFLESYLGYHLFARLSGSIEGHTGGPLFYLGVLVDGQRAWFLATLVAMPYAAWRALREALRS